jgi:hypothetical protein
VPFFTSLEINGPWQLFVAVQGATCDTWNFLVIDDRLAVLHHRDPSSYQGSVKGLPFARATRGVPAMRRENRTSRRCGESRRFLPRIGLGLGPHSGRACNISLFEFALQSAAIALGLGLPIPRRSRTTNRALDTAGSLIVSAKTCATMMTTVCYRIAVLGETA